MLEIFSWDRHPEVEGDDITVVVAAVVKKYTTRWRMRRCASRLCHNHAHHKLNVEGRSFILLFVIFLKCLSFVVVGGGEDVNRKWLY